MINRRDEIKAKGFSIPDYSNDTNSVPEVSRNTDFSKIRVGAKTLDDAVLEFSGLKKVNPRIVDKDFVLRAIDNCNFA